jgi:septal ring factor EnvC (AmiA/AmiB activator)
MSDVIQDALAKLEGKLDLAVKDFADLKARVAEIGAPNTQVELILAGTNARIDLVDERLARIADRLDVIRRDLAAQAGALEITK